MGNRTSYINIIKAYINDCISPKTSLEQLQPHQTKKEKGFWYRNVEYIHHSDLDHKESAFFVLFGHQKAILVIGILTFITGLFIDWHVTLIIFIAVITIIYFLDLLFHFYLIYRSFSKNPEIQVSEEEILLLKKKDLKKYTILCPLYKEKRIISQFIKAMDAIDYPKEQLEILILIEEDDGEIKEALEKMSLSNIFHIILIPHSLPKTKPKALNFGLQKTTGEYIVIYDAEDIPDLQQLKKAICAFKKTDNRVICIQAKLNFYNVHQNILTKLFTAEYALWFDLILTGLQSINGPIPLGGTSNHFKTSYLREIKGWDSFNVTEDCDLGLRIAKKGYKTAIMNSLTFEEANSHHLNWLHQRSRWIKGYIQTYLVHMRQPSDFLKKWDGQHIITLQFVVGGKFLSMFINPFMWITTIGYFLLRVRVGTTIESFYPSSIFYLGVFSLIIGNFLYMYSYMIGCVKQGYFELIKYLYFVPLYWLGMSLAAWKAGISLIISPHYWSKTIHGFHLKEHQETLSNLRIDSTDTFSHE